VRETPRYRGILGAVRSWSRLSAARGNVMVERSPHAYSPVARIHRHAFPACWRFSGAITPPRESASSSAPTHTAPRAAPLLAPVCFEIGEHALHHEARCTLLLG
jgi:hypothetical protein